MSPLPGTRIIPAGWSQHHARAMPTAMNARVAFTDPSRSVPGEWNPESGTYDPATLHYVAGGPDDTRPEWREGVPVRLQPLDSLAEDLQTTQQVATRRYLLQLPFGLPDVQVDHEARITWALNDEHAGGLVLTIVDEQHASERFTRDLVAEHNQQRTPGG